jgi:hypothetical protein
VIFLGHKHFRYDLLKLSVPMRNFAWSESRVCRCALTRRRDDSRHLGKCESEVSESSDIYIENFWNRVHSRVNRRP